MRAIDLEDLDGVKTLLEFVVDSYEKLDILVHLYQARRRGQTVASIARSLRLAPDAVAETLACLRRAGLVCTRERNDDVGWWYDPAAAWAASVDVLVDLYELDRSELLWFMRHVVLRSFGSPRPRARKPLANN